MALKTANLAFHTLALVHHVYTLKYLSGDIDYSKTDDPKVKEMEEFGPRYMTTWNLIIQTIYLFLSLYIDMTDFTSTKKSKLALLVQKYKGYIYSVIMFPTTLCISIMFWILYWINREWVLPETADAVAPKWVNHSMHTIVVLVIFVELLLAKKGMSKPEYKTAVNILTVFGFIYFGQFFFTYFREGRWIYRIFYDLTWFERIALVAFNFVLTFAFCKLGFVLQSYRRRSKKLN